MKRWKERKNERCIDTVYGRIIFETYVDRHIDIINEIDKIDKTNEIDKNNRMIDEIDKNDRMIDENNRYNHSTEINRHTHACVSLHLCVLEIKRYSKYAYFRTRFSCLCQHLPRDIKFYGHINHKDTDAEKHPSVQPSNHPWMLSVSLQPGTIHLGADRFRRGGRRGVLLHFDGAQLAWLQIFDTTESQCNTTLVVGINRFNMIQ